MDARLPSGISFNLRRHESYLEPADRHREVGEPEYAEFRVTTTQTKAEEHKRYLPLLEVSLDVKVVATTSRTVLTQTFSNYSTIPIQEAQYSFPLYDGSTVVSFRCWIGSDNMLEGVVKSKEAARAEYQEAVSRQRVAALLEEHTPEIFETSVGNIPMKTVVKVEIVYINELKASVGDGATDVEDGVLVTIPTSVAPRYGSPPTGYIEKPGVGSALLAENGLRIQVEVSAPVPIRKLESRTHPISVELGSEGHPTPTKELRDLASGSKTTGFDPKKARAVLSDRTTALGKDFVLLILVTGPSLLTPRALVEPHPKLADHSAMMVAFTPRDLFTSHLPPGSSNAEVIFLADRSGSMGNKIDALRSALKVFLRSIPQGCHFNICSFGSNHLSMWPRSRPYNQENLDIANGLISTSFHADMGGTELLPALKSVTQQRITKENLTTEVIILTDGEVWNTEDTIDFVRKTRTDTREKVRFFALGIGDSVSHRLIEGIGRQGGGFAEVVAVDAAGRWESRVIRMLKGALTPPRWQCEIALGKESVAFSPLNGRNISSEPDPSIQQPAYIQAPHNIPALHAFSRYVVYLFLSKQITPPNNAITIRAVASTGEKVAVRIPLERIEPGTHTIHHLAAKALMNDLETSQSWLHAEMYEKYRASHPDAFEQVVRGEAESIGKQWSITGKWTSFVAVDSSGQLEKVARVYRAERSEISELMRSRGVIRPLNSFNDLQRMGMSIGSINELTPQYSHPIGAPCGSLMSSPLASGRRTSASSLVSFSDAGFKGSSSDSDELSCGLSREPPYRPPISQRLRSGISSRARGYPSVGAVRPSTRTSLSETSKSRMSWILPTGGKVSHTPVARQSISLAGLIELQSSSGSFSLEKCDFRKTLLDSFSTGLLEEMVKCLKKKSIPFMFLMTRPRTICETVIVTVYIQQKFTSSYELWELVVQKAKGWLQSQIKDNKVQEVLETMAQDGFQGEQVDGDASLSLSGTKDSLTTLEGGEENAVGEEANPEDQLN